MEQSKNLAGTGKRKVLGFTVVAALGGLLFGFDTAVISGTTGALKDLFELSEGWKGFTVATALLGCMAGSLLVSRPADIWGRRNTLIVMAVLYTVSALGSGFAWSLHSFWVFRFIGGIAVGGASVLSPMYIAEISPAKLRGRLVGWQQFNVCFGICLAYISNYLVAICPYFADAVDGLMAQWRWMFIMEAFPAVAFFLLLFKLPYSPRWLVEKHRVDQARDVLVQLNAEDVGGVLDEIVESLRDSADVVHEKFWHRKYSIPIIGAIGIAAFNQFSGINALLYYAPEVFTMGGSDVDTALLQSIPIGIALVISTMLGLCLIDKLGRKFLLITGSLGMAACLAMVARGFYLMGAQEDIGKEILWYFIGYILFFGPSTGAVVWVFISEIFPNKVRAKGQALGSFTVWVTAVMVAQSFPVAKSITWIGPGHCFMFFAVCMVLQAVFVWRVLPETKGVSLEQMQRKLGID
jgi:sugar porter (SP) family MFS transporter